MKQRVFWFRATWGSCFVFLFLPSLIPMSVGATRVAAAVGLLLFALGIIQAIRNELYKGERLKALARGECPSCGQDLRGKDAGECPECGEAVGGET